MALDIFFKVIGGLGIFMFGMHHMSGGMQKLAGDRLKKILAALTTNRFMAIIMGVFVTGMVQSSSVSTVMTIGFVNAGLMNLKQALGVILGANIGTTITGWILVLKIGKYGLPIAGIAGLLYMFSKSEKGKTKALTMLGFGFIFFGLELMSNGFKPLRTMPEFIEMFHKFQATSYTGIMAAALIGCLMTMIVQSSSATLGITITLAMQGLIDPDTAVALVLGENVGTTVTACLASIGAKANAKRTAYAHTIINIIGVTWVVAIFPFYIKFLHSIVDSSHNVTEFIATAHTMFNVTNVVLFIPFIGVLAKFLDKVVKNDSEEAAAETVTHLDIRMTETPTVVVAQTKKEVHEMSLDIESVMKSVKNIILSTDNIDAECKVVSDIEEKLDLVQKEITDVNFEIMAKDLSESDIAETRLNLEITDEYETISDYFLRISKSIKKLDDNEILLNNNKKETLENLHNKVEEFFGYVNRNYEVGGAENLVEAMQKAADIKDLYKKARRDHMARVSENKMPAILSTTYMDILNHYRRIKDHMVNVVEAMSV